MSGWLLVGTFSLVTFSTTCMGRNLANSPLSYLLESNTKSATNASWLMRSWLWVTYSMRGFSKLVHISHQNLVPLPLWSFEPVTLRNFSQTEVMVCQVGELVLFFATCGIVCSPHSYTDLRHLTQSASGFVIRPQHSFMINAWFCFSRFLMPKPPSPFSCVIFSQATRYIFLLLVSWDYKKVLLSLSNSLITPLGSSADCIWYEGSADRTAPINTVLSAMFKNLPFQEAKCNLAFLVMCS